MAKYFIGWGVLKPTGFSDFKDDKKKAKFSNEEGGAKFLGTFSFTSLGLQKSSQISNRT